MTNENPYLNLMDKNTDDELFEIIENPDKSNNALLYEAAVNISLNRELITEYQAKNLLEGNTSVLQYNPGNLGDQDNSYVIEKEIHVKKSKPLDKTDIKIGLTLIGIGVLILLLTYVRSTIDFWGISFVSIKGIIVGFASLFLGIIVLLIGVVKKWSGIKNKR